MKSPNQRLVMIEWEDSCSQSGLWKSPKDISGTPKTCFTVGWVVKENKKALTVASSAGLNDTDGFDHISGDMTIPKGCIVRTKTLSRKRL